MSGSIYLCFTIFCASVIIRLEVLFLVLFSFSLMAVDILMIQFVMEVSSNCVTLS